MDIGMTIKMILEKQAENIKNLEKAPSKKIQKNDTEWEEWKKRENEKEKKEKRK